MKSVIVILKENDYEERKSELKMLASTGGYEVAGVFAQSGKPRAKFLVGKGKVKEIKNFIKENGIGLVIFENYLSSRQVASLEEELEARVMDKFDLILDIFEKHASSKEALLQIELARLKRKLPYVKMMLSKKVKEEHPGFGSGGEYIIHSTLRRMHKRIKKIESELEKYKSRVETQGKRRKKKGKIVALVGYTNVGKTTILNKLTGAKKEVRDEVFTTLKSKTTSLKQEIFITDTIGFIRNLPHELIYAFRATLGEIKNSDLILLILDAGKPIEEFSNEMEVCEETLIKIGADGIPVLYVLNKIDLANDITKKEELLPSHVKVSAKYGSGLDELKERILDVLDEGIERD